MPRLFESCAHRIPHRGLANAAIVWSPGEVNGVGAHWMGRGASAPGECRTRLRVVCIPHTVQGFCQCCTYLRRGARPMALAPGGWAKGRWPRRVKPWRVEGFQRMLCSFEVQARPMALARGG